MILQCIPGEKHSLNNLIVGLHDAKSRLLWTSDDPTNSRQAAGASVFDFYPPEEQDKLRVVIAKCFLDGEEVGHVANAGSWPPGPEGRPAKWRITYLPISVPSCPGIAGMGFGSRLPDNYDEITEDDKILLRLLADDLSHKEISAEIHRSESAVDAKIRALKDKLGCKGIGGLVGKALQQSII